MMQLSSRNAKSAHSVQTVCKRFYSTTQLNKLEEFTEAEQMLRPASKKELNIVSFHKKHFRKSRFETYDVGTGRNTNAQVRGDPVPNKNDMNFKFALTAKVNSPLPSREVFGEKALKEAKEKGNTLDAKWYNKAMYDTGSAAQVDELFDLATKAGVVDNKLISTYIYTIARRNGQEKAIAKYESVKNNADNEIHASGAAAYAKAMNPKALDIYKSLIDGQGLQNVPARVHAAIMTYYFDNGQVSKGTDVFNSFEKAGGKADVKMLTSLLRGHRHSKSIEQSQKIFDSITERGLTPDKDAYSELIIAYSKSTSNNISTMMSKIEAMKNAGHRVPHYVYSSAIRAMLANDEFHNGLMTLDVQYREGAYPLDKRIVLSLAHFFSKEERGMRVRPKTEYTIWVAKQAGLYTKDLTYLTTQHVDFLDEYYFRHHPEHDYPDAYKRPYQYKDFDEYALYTPEEDRNPFKPKLSDVEKPDRTLWEDLPDFLEYAIPTAGSLNIEPQEFKLPEKAEKQIEEYDKHVWSLWTQKSALEKAKEDQEKAAQEALRAIEEKAAKAAEAEKPASEEEIKKAEDKAMEAEEKAAEAKEEAIKAEERAEQARILAKNREVEKSEAKEFVETRREMADIEVEKVESKASEAEAKAEKAEEEAAKAVKNAEEAEKEADKATVEELKAEGQISAEELKKPEATSLRAEEEEEEEQDKSEEEMDEKAEVEDEFGGIMQTQPKLIGGFTTRPDDSILEPGQRMPDFVRKELVQQARVERLIDLVESLNRIPPALPHTLIAGLDTQRLKEFIKACERAGESLIREPENVLRPAVDLYLSTQYIKTYTKQAEKELRYRVKGITQVYKPLDLEERRADLYGNPLVFSQMADMLETISSPPPADTQILDIVNFEETIEQIEKEFDLEKGVEMGEGENAEGEKSSEEMKSWELVNKSEKGKSKKQ